MEFKLTEEQLAVKDAARDFAKNVLLPEVRERDKEARFPKEEVKQLGELGFFGMMTDPKYGGGGMDSVSYVLAMEEISKVDASVSVIMSVCNSLVAWGLETYGTEEQKQKYLVPLASGQMTGAFCWITNGGTAGVYIVIAQTDREKGHRGINALIVEAGLDGFIVGEKEDKMGIRGSDTHTLIFNDVKIPKENRIGEEGFGFKFAMSTLGGGRIGIASQAMGIASGALDLAIAYSKERKTFGKEIHRHQAIAFKLADMATKVEAARLLCLKAATLKDEGKDFAQAASMAKLYASKIAQEVTSEAVQIHGGYGYVREYHVERMMRDAKITQIYEGTSEIQKIVISRSLLAD